MDTGPDKYWGLADRTTGPAIRKQLYDSLSARGGSINITKRTRVTKGKLYGPHRSSFFAAIKEWGDGPKPWVWSEQKTTVDAVVTISGFDALMRFCDFGVFDSSRAYGCARWTLNRLDFLVGVNLRLTHSIDIATNLNVVHWEFAVSAVGSSGRVPSPLRDEQKRPIELPPATVRDILKLPREVYGQVLGKTDDMDDNRRHVILAKELLKVARGTKEPHEAWSATPSSLWTEASDSEEEVCLLCTKF